VLKIMVMIVDQHQRYPENVQVSTSVMWDDLIQALDAVARADPDASGLERFRRIAAPYDSKDPEGNNALNMEDSTRTFAKIRTIPEPPASDPPRITLNIIDRHREENPLYITCGRRFKIFPETSEAEILALWQQTVGDESSLMMTWRS
jgi:hypothetical protein